jgi:murein L,D-transpeptidase YcbB/YkuD
MGGMQIQKAFSGKGEAYYKLQRPEPVYILYLTSWVGENGQLNFRPDVYGRDSILAKAVFGNSYK